MRFSAYFFTFLVAIAQGCGSKIAKPPEQNEKDVDVDENVDSSTGGGTDNGDNEDNGENGEGAKSQSCVDNPTPFVSVWRTHEANEKVTLPLVTDAGDYDITIDWGDGEVSGVSNAIVSHTYASAGEHIIKIEGHIGSAWNFEKALNRQGAGKTYPEGSITLSQKQLISIGDLGSIGWKSLKGAFSGAKNIKKVAGGCTDEVTDMAKVFVNILPTMKELARSDFEFPASQLSVNYFDVDFSSWNFSSIASGDGLNNLFSYNYGQSNPDDPDFKRYDDFENHCEDECINSTSFAGGLCGGLCDSWAGSLSTEIYSMLLKRFADTPENGGLRDDVTDVVMTVPAKYNADAAISRTNLENHHNFTFYDLGEASSQ